MRDERSSAGGATGAGGPSLRRRAASFALAVAINLLLLLALLTLNPPPIGKPPRGSAPTLLDLSPAAEPVPVATQADAAPARETQRRAEPPPADPAEVAPPPEPPPPQPRDERPLPFLVLSREDYAASDIARFNDRPAPPARSGERLASASRDSPQVGVAPNGEPLYQAEWYRRPTRAELSSYLPSSGRVEGWGLIACRTVAQYRVEDCVELADSPPGSRLAGAVRQAAWQFRVRPPRVGGKELVGTWVRIRIDYRAEEG